MRQGKRPKREWTRGWCRRIHVQRDLLIRLTGLRENGIGPATAVAEFTIDPSYRGWTFAGVPDPRVALTNQNRFAAGDGRPLWTADKYPTVTIPIPLATWREAD